MFPKVAAAIILAGVALAQTFSINTPPSIQQCQPAALSWVGGTAPYILAAIPAGQVSAAAIATIAENVAGTSYSWNVNLAQGTAITIKITDSTGALAYSSPLTVQAGGTGCLSSSASGSASASASGSLSSSVSRSATTTSSAAPTTSSAVVTSSASSASSASSSSASTSRASTAASSSTSSAAAFSKAVLNVPVLALAAVGGFIAVGGAVALF